MITLVNRVWPVSGGKKIAQLQHRTWFELPAKFNTYSKENIWITFCELNIGFDYHACTAVTYKY